MSFFDLRTQLGIPQMAIDAMLRSAGTESEAARRAVQEAQTGVNNAVAAPVAPAPGPGFGPTFIAQALANIGTALSGRPEYSAGASRAIEQSQEERLAAARQQRQELIATRIEALRSAAGHLENINTFEAETKRANLLNQANKLSEENIAALGRKSAETIAAGRNAADIQQEQVRQAGENKRAQMAANADAARLRMQALLEGMKQGKLPTFDSSGKLTGFSPIEFGMDTESRGAILADARNTALKLKDQKAAGGYLARSFLGLPKAVNQPLGDWLIEGQSFGLNPADPRIKKIVATVAAQRFPGEQLPAEWQVAAKPLSPDVSSAISVGPITPNKLKILYFMVTGGEQPTKEEMEFLKSIMIGGGALLRSTGPILKAAYKY